MVFPSLLGPRPAKNLKLYEYEGCPYCRKVRDVLTELDLNAEIYPCAKGGRFRSVVESKGGKQQFPFLEDPNTGAELYESEAIIDYLVTHYGTGKRPPGAFAPLSTATSSFASVFRFAGLSARPSREPEKKLTLYSFEASPYCRLVREALCELSIPYVLINVGKRSQNRPGFRKVSGRMMVPYLIDPNTELAMFESEDIVRYLNEQYATTH